MKKDKLAVPVKSLSQRKREAVLKGGKTQDVYETVSGQGAITVRRKEAKKGGKTENPYMDLLSREFLKMQLQGSKKIKTGCVSLPVKTTKGKITLGELDKGKKIYFLVLERKFKPEVLERVKSTVMFEKTRTTGRAVLGLSEEAVFALAQICNKVVEGIMKKNKSATIRDVAWFTGKKRKSK